MDDPIVQAKTRTATKWVDRANLPDRLKSDTHARAEEVCRTLGVVDPTVATIGVCSRSKSANRISLRRLIAIPISCSVSEEADQARGDYFTHWGRHRLADLIDLR
jgi:hypothetical protein